MKVAEIIRKVLDLLDSEQEVIDSKESNTGPEVELELDLDCLAKLAGIEQAESAEDLVYANEPHEQYRTNSSIFTSGTDINKSKHPADIRTNAGSMFPDFQARDI